VIKILQGNVVTETVSDGQTIYTVPRLPTAYSVYVSKIMKIGRQ